MWIESICLFWLNAKLLLFLRSPFPRNYLHKLPVFFGIKFIVRLDLVWNSLYEFRIIAVRLRLENSLETFPSQEDAVAAATHQLFNGSRVFSHFTRETVAVVWVELSERLNCNFRTNAILCDVTCVLFCFVFFFLLLFLP